MIEEKAQVVAIDDSSVWVEAKRESACGRCAANKGCGSAVLQKVFGNRKNILPVIYNPEASELLLHVGDEVIIGVNEDAIVKNSFVVYALPVMTVIIFAALGETFLKDMLSISRDLAGIGGAVVGFAVSVLVLRWYNRRAGQRAGNHPVILRRAENTGHHAGIKILG